jgi:hypothetical protein
MLPEAGPVVKLWRGRAQSFLELIARFIYLWENGHDDSFDFNVLWQKAVFISCNIVQLRQ